MHYPTHDNHRRDSVYDLSKKNQFMEMNVYYGDNFDSFKFDTEALVWHIIHPGLANKQTIFNFIDECKSSEVKSESDSDYEKVEDD